MVCKSASGVGGGARRGQGLPVVASVGAQGGSLTQAWSYNFPIVSSPFFHNSNVPVTGSVIASLSGLSFGLYLSLGVRLGTSSDSVLFMSISSCLSSIWISDSCLSSKVVSGIAGGSSANRFYSVIVSNSGPSSSLSFAFTYDLPFPSSVKNSPTSGSHHVVLSGSGFGFHSMSPSTCLGVSAAEVSMWISTSIVISKVSRGVSNLLSFRISYSGLRSTRSQAFSYDFPVVTSIRPLSPSVNGTNSFVGNTTEGIHTFEIAGSSFGSFLFGGLGTADLHTLLEFGHEPNRNKYKCVPWFVFETVYRCQFDAGIGKGLLFKLSVGNQVLMVNSSLYNFSFPPPAIQTGTLLLYIRNISHQTSHNISLISGPTSAVNGTTSNGGDILVMTGMNFGPDPSAEAVVTMTRWNSRFVFYLQSCNISAYISHTSICLIVPQGVGKDLVISIRLDNQGMNSTNNYSYPLDVILDRYQVSAALSSVRGLAISLGTAGVDTVFTVQLKDFLGNPFSRGGVFLDVTLRGPGVFLGRIEDNRDGTYTVWHNPTQSGRYQHAVNLLPEMLPIDSSPIAYVSWPHLLLQPPLARVSGLMNAVLTAGSPFAFAVNVLDKFGNILHIYNISTSTFFTLNVLQGPGPTDVVRDSQLFRSPAVMPYTIYPTRSGNYIVNLLFANATVLDPLMPINISFNCQPSIVHGPSCLSDGITVYEAGESATFTVQSRDVFHNSRTVGGDNFVCQIMSSTSISLPCQIRDLNSGVYNFAFTITRAGTYVLSLMVARDGAHTRGSPISIRIRPGAASASASNLGGTFKDVPAGFLSNVLLIMRDRFYNPTDCQPSDFEISATSQGAAANFAVILNSNISSLPYFAFFVTRAGSYTLKVLHKSLSLLGCPLSFNVVPATFDLNVSFVRGFASFGAVVGGGSVCGEFLPSDMYGNLISAGSLSMTADVAPLNTAELTTSFFSSVGSLAFCYAPKAVGNITLSFISAIGRAKQYLVPISSSGTTFCATKSHITSPSHTIANAGTIVTFQVLASDSMGFRASTYPSSCILKEQNSKLSDRSVSDQGGSSLSVGLYLTASSQYSFAIMCATNQVGGNISLNVVPASIDESVSFVDYSPSSTMFTVGDTVTFILRIRDAFNNSLSMPIGGFVDGFSLEGPITRRISVLSSNISLVVTVTGNYTLAMNINGDLVYRKLFVFSVASGAASCSASTSFFSILGWIPGSTIMAGSNLTFQVSLRDNFANAVTRTSQVSLLANQSVVASTSSSEYISFVVTKSGLYNFAIRVQQSSNCDTAFSLSPVVTAAFAPTSVSGQISVSPTDMPLVGSSVTFSITLLDKFGNVVCDLPLQPLSFRLTSQNSQIFITPTASTLCTVIFPWIVSVNGSIVAAASFAGLDIVNKTITAIPGYASIISFAAIPAPIFTGQSFELLVSFFDIAGNPTVLVSGMHCQINSTLMTATTVPGAPISIPASGTTTATKAVLVTISGQYVGSCFVNGQRIRPAFWPLTVYPGHANASASSLDTMSCQNSTAPVVCVVYVNLADSYGNILSSSSISLDVSLLVSPSLPASKLSVEDGRLFFPLMISSPGTYTLSCSLGVLGSLPTFSFTTTASASVSLISLAHSFVSEPDVDLRSLVTAGELVPLSMTLKRSNLSSLSFSSATVVIGNISQTVSLVSNSGSFVAQFSGRYTASIIVDGVKMLTWSMLVQPDTASPLTTSLLNPPRNVFSTSSTLISLTARDKFGNVIVKSVSVNSVLNSIDSSVRLFFEPATTSLCNCHTSSVGFTRSGQYTLNVQLQGGNIVGSPHLVTTLPSKASAVVSSFLPSITTMITVGNVVSLSLQLRDSFGNEQFTMEEAVTVNILTPGLSVPSEQFAPNSQGIVSIRWTVTFAATYTLTISLSDSSIVANSFQFLAIPSMASTVPRITSVINAAVCGQGYCSQAGQSVSVVVSAFDSFGNPTGMFSLSNPVCLLKATNAPTSDVPVVNKTHTSIHVVYTIRTAGEYIFAESATGSSWSAIVVVSPSTISLSTFGVSGTCLNDLSMLAGFNCFIQVVLRDAFGNSAISDTTTSAVVRMYMSEAKTAVASQLTLPVSNAHQIHWLVTASGLYQISIQNSADQSLVRNFDVNVRPAPLCASTSVVVGPGIMGAVVNQIMTLSVVIRDHYGNVADDAKSSDVSISGVPAVLGPGTTFSYSLSTTGTFQFNVRVQSMPVMGSPFSVVVRSTAGAPTAARSAWTSPLVRSSVSGAASVIQFLASDSSDAPASDSSSSFVVASSGFQELKHLFEVVSPGNWQIRLQLTMSGSYTLPAYIAGTLVASTLELRVVPSSVSVYTSKLSNFATTLTAGSMSSFVMNTKDEYGNSMQLLPGFDKRFSVSIVDSFQKSAPYVFRATESIFGAYVVLWTVTVAGSFTLNVELDGIVCPFASEPFVVMTGPINPSLSSLDFSSLGSFQAGASVASAFVIRDSYGNRLRFGSLGISRDFSLSLSHLSQSLELAYQLNVSSAVTSLFVVSASVAGRYAVSLLVLGQNVLMTASVFVSPGPADILTAVDTDSAGRLFVDTTAVISIVWKDSFGNNVTMAPALFEVKAHFSARIFGLSSNGSITTMSFTPLEVCDTPGNSLCVLNVSWSGKQVIKVVRIFIVPAPYLVSATFSDSGIQLLIVFNVPVRFWISNSSMACDNLFTGGLGSSASCGLMQPNIIAATLSTDATIIPGSAACLVPGRISSATHQSSNATGCIAVISPANPVQPKIVISGTLAGSACAPLVADLRASGGSAGRVMAYLWSLPLLGSGLSLIQPLLTTSEALGGRLVLSAGILTEGQSVNISVRVSNFLGASSFAFVLFQRLSAESPSISVEKSVLTDPITSAESLLLKAVLAQSPCIASPLSYNLRWTYVGRGHNPLIGVDITQPSVLLSLKRVSSAALLKFNLFVNSTAGESSFAFDVIAPARALYAKLKTSYLEHSQQIPFTIDGSLSGSSDGNTADLIYAWTCTPAPCFAAPLIASAIMSSSLSLISLPAGVMLPGTHVFALIVSANGITTSASVTVVTWRESRPSVALPGPFLKGFSSASKVAIEASVNTSMCSDSPQLQWSVLPELFGNGFTLAASVLSNLSSPTLVFAPKALLGGCRYVATLKVSCRCAGTPCESSANTSFFASQPLVPGLLQLSTSSLTPFQTVVVNATRWSFDSSCTPVVYEAYISVVGSSNLVFIGKSHSFLFDAKVPCLRAANSSQDASFVRVIARDYSGQSAFMDVSVTLLTCPPPATVAAASAAISASVTAAVQLQSAGLLIASLASARAYVKSSSSSRRLLAASNVESLVLENIASSLLLLNSEPPSIVDSQTRLSLVNDAFLALPASLNVQKQSAEAFKIIMSRTLPQPASAIISSLTGVFLSNQLGRLNASIGSNPGSELAAVFDILNEGIRGFVASENRLMTSYELAVSITTSTLLFRYFRLSPSGQIQAAVAVCPAFGLCSSVLESPTFPRAVGMFMLASSQSPWLNVPVTNMSTALHMQLVSETPAAIGYTSNTPTVFSFVHPESLVQKCIRYDVSSNSWSSYGCLASRPSTFTVTTCTCYSDGTMATTPVVAPNSAKAIDYLISPVTITEKIIYFRPTVLIIVCSLFAFALMTIAAAGYYDRWKALRAAKQDAVVTESAIAKWLRIKWTDAHAVCTYWARHARKPPHLRAEPLLVSMFHMWLSFMAQHSSIPKLIAFDDARVPVPCFVRVAIFWSHQFAMMALAIGLVATPFFELKDWPLLALVVASLVFPFPWAFRRLCDEYFWRVSDVKGKVSIHDSWAKKIAARTRLPGASAPPQTDVSGSSPTPRSRSHSRDNTPEREVRTLTAPQPTSGRATPRRSRSSSRDAPPTSGRATPRRSSSRSGEVVAQAAASSDQANKEFLAFRQRERERREMSFPASASVLLIFAMASTAAMAIWTAARYSVEFEVPHHTMWGATYGLAVLFHLAVLEPVLCIILELRELFSSYTKVTCLFILFRVKRR
jgi:hypothetical protein